MIDVGRQTVANIDHGMKVGDLMKPQRLSNPRRKSEMFAADTAAQRPGRKQPIPWSGSGAANRAAPGRLTHDRDGNHQRPVPGIRIPTNNGRLELIGDLAKPQVKLLRQSPAALLGQSDAHHRRHGKPSHGGDVAQIHCQGFSADGSRSRFGQAKTCAFHEHIGGDQTGDVRPWMNGRRIIAWSYQNPRIRWSPLPQPIDVGEFASGGSHISSPETCRVG
jgi:hypothetical protein